MEQPLNVRLVSEALSEVEVLELDGREAINELFEHVVSVRSLSSAGLDESQVMGRPVIIVFDPPTGLSRKVHGIVAAMQELDDVGPGTGATYQLQIVPRAWWLAQGATSEVFTDLTVPQIIASKLARSGLAIGTDFELRLTQSYPTRELVLQYEESDFQLISRLAEHVGISFYFENRDDRCVIVFCDANSGFSTAGTLAFRPSGERGALSIESRTQCLPQQYSVRDYNYRTPTVPLEALAKVANDGLARVDEFGSHFKSPNEAESLARIRAEELSARRVVMHGRSDLHLVAAGTRRDLRGHPRRDTELLVTEVRHRVRQTVLGRAERPASYENDLRAVPAATAFRPERRTPKPRIHGSVVGIIEAAEPGQYADVDELGRYRVRFLLDRGGADHARASHPVRMAQPHAGPGYGFHFPLRDGVEVMIVFMQGDPDRPVIAGALPNPTTPSTVATPNARRNVIRTGAGNEINIDDAEGSERIRFFSPFANTVLSLGAPNGCPGVWVCTDEDVRMIGKKGGHFGVDLRLDLTAGEYLTVKAPEIDVVAASRLGLYGGTVEILSGSDRVDQTVAKHSIQAQLIDVVGDETVQVVTPKFEVYADEILLTTNGGAYIRLSGATVEIVGDPIDLNP